MFNLHDSGLDTNATDIKADADLYDLDNLDDLDDSDDNLFSFSANDMFNLKDSNNLDTDTTNIEDNASVNNCIDIYNLN